MGFHENKMPNLKHFDGFGTIRFVTFSCHKRLPLLVDEKDILIFLNYLSEIKDKYEIKLFSYVIMPEHIHLVMLPKDTDKLGLIIGKLKSLSAREILGRWQSINHSILGDLRVLRDGMSKHAFWQKRCFDFNCRTRESAIEKINYCHKNPVTRGLVKNPEDWRWSSYKWYLNKKPGIIEIDILEV